MFSNDLQKHTCYLHFMFKRVVIFADQTVYNYLLGRLFPHNVIESSKKKGGGIIQDTKDKNYLFSL